MIIPALDEERALPRVLGDLPRDLVDEIIVVDNGSTDATAEVARRLGATVVAEPRRGYGSACLAAIAYLRGRRPPPAIVAFLDADYSDDPAELARLLGPILADTAEFVVGSRTLSAASRGSLTPQQRFGNALAALLIRRLHGVRVTDLGPFRAIRWEALERLGMSDPDYGWTAEMQVKAARLGLRTTEIAVSYRPRIGRSKISGTLRGSALAGVKILRTVLFS